MPSKLNNLTTQDPQIQRITERTVVGKDVLELVSSAMYLDPLTIFREYVQNAADAIDEAAAAGLYKRRTKPRIDIWLSPSERCIRIRDNGSGIRKSSFVRTLTSLGASRKRGSKARGFRGIGRLAGLGYCQKLIFRTRTRDQPRVWELHWDCRLLKQALQDPTNSAGLDDVIQSIAMVCSATKSEDYPDHFFEVELQGVVRYKNDLLLNREAVGTYLSQIGPVPFHPDFSYGSQIESFLSKWHLGAAYKIHLDDSPRALFRPFSDIFLSRTCIQDQFVEFEPIVLGGTSEEVAAVGWILHHGYYGALSEKLGFKGLRIRKGNIQVGSDALLDDMFPESRFNAWCVGEIHAISDKLIPNGRRDSFDHNRLFLHIESQLRPYGQKLARRCRAESQTRNRAKLYAGALAIDREPSSRTKVTESKPLITADQEAVLRRLDPKRADAFRSVVSTLYELCGSPARSVINSLFQILAKN